MQRIFRNIMAVVIGLIIGNVVNYYLFHYGFKVFPIDADLNDMEALEMVFPTLSLKYYLFPLLGHAFGTFTGALLAAFFAVSHKFKLAMGVGATFLLVGILAAIVIPPPLWFKVLDLGISYLPMAWIAGKLLTKKKII